MAQDQKKAFGCFGVFIVLLAIVYSGFFSGFHFGAIDDYEFLKGPLQGQFQPWNVRPAEGRFLPLSGQEYDLLAFVDHPTANQFYLINFFILVGFAFGLFWILRWNFWRFLALFLLVFLTAGFQTSFSRLYVGEKLSLFFLVFYFGLYFKKDRTLFEKILYVLSGSLALYCKETNFILIAIPSVADLISRYRENRKLLIEDLLLTGHCALFLLIYYFFIKRQAVAYYDGGVSDDKKTILLKYLLSDPLAFAGFALILPQLSWNRLKENALLAAIGLFALAYVVLGLYSQFYLAPIYIGLALLLTRYELPRKWVVPGIFLYLLIYLGAGLAAYSYWRQMPASMQDLVQRLARSGADTIEVADCGDSNYEWKVGLQKWFQYSTHKELKIVATDSTKPADQQTFRILTPTYGRPIDLSGITGRRPYIPEYSPRTLIKYLKNKYRPGQLQNYNIFEDPNFYVLNAPQGE